MLVQVLISIGMMGILATGFATLFSNQIQQTKILAQKYEMLELKNALMTTFIDPAICTCQLNPTQSIGSTHPSDLQFNGAANTPQAMDVKFIRAGCDPTDSPIIVQENELLPGTQTNLRVKSVRLVDIQNANVNVYVGYWEIQFESSLGTYARTPIRVKQRFSTDISFISQAKVTACESSTNSTNPTTPTSTPGFSNMKVYNNPGTYSFQVPVSVSKVRVQVWGGGGGGAGGSPSYPDKRNAGGGGGGYADAIVDVVPNQSYTVIVGKAGAGGPQITKGGHGDDSSFGGSLVKATGGKGGGHGPGVFGLLFGGDPGIGSGPAEQTHVLKGGAGFNSSTTGESLGYGGKGANGGNGGSFRERHFNGDAPGGGGSGGPNALVYPVDPKGGDGGHGRVIIWY